MPGTMPRTSNVNQPPRGPYYQVQHSFPVYVCRSVACGTPLGYTQGPDRWDPINGNYGKSGECVTVQWPWAQAVT